MRLSKYLASLPELKLSRRKADELIEQGVVFVEDSKAIIGEQIREGSKITLFKKDYIFTSEPQTVTTVLINKPYGVVCSRDGQGKKSIYELIPKNLHDLKVAGRLDSDSTGLVILTNSGDQIQQLTHPSKNHKKLYEIKLSKVLSAEDANQIINRGVNIGDARASRFNVRKVEDHYEVTLSEGRNRQIRRTFEKLGYHVTRLHRTRMGQFELGELKIGAFKEV
jgi:pseudouridine synthase